MITKKILNLQNRLNKKNNKLFNITSARIVYWESDVPLAKNISQSLSYVFKKDYKKFRSAVPSEKIKLLHQVCHSARIDYNITESQLLKFLKSYSKNFILLIKYFFKNDKISFYDIEKNKFSTHRNIKII